MVAIIGHSGWLDGRACDRTAILERRTIRWRPRPFRVLVAALSWIFAFYAPQKSFEGFYVKDLALDSHAAT